ncbi:MAG: Oligopeptide transport ATP-binding protein OppD [Pseudomonadales bacterium]|nr:Oligopeptide transport ATP-binding protein OppD [Pseudomonadales bacterium]
MSAPVLELEALRVAFPTRAGTVHAVRGVSWSVARGHTLAVVGESGCGKSVSVQAALGLLDPRLGCVAGGSARLHGRELLGLGARELARVHGGEVGMIFQDPMSALNPTMRIGTQIAEVLVRHRGIGWREAEREAVDLLSRMRIARAAERARRYPFEFSGGMLQRAMIAIAIACRPALLIADEPTTALDATVQDEVLALIIAIQREDAMALVLITHDLGIVARMADEVAVMYAGEIIEHGDVDELFRRPAHPYTAALLQALPASERSRLSAIAGSPPDLLAPPRGCAFAARCPQAMRICAERTPAATLHAAAHRSHCWRHHPLAAAARTGPAR